jgi:protein-disulfide isomerase
MENKSILLVVASILFSGMMIASAIIYSSAQNNTNTNAPTVDNSDPVEARDITVDLSDDTPYLGDKAKAEVVIIEFSDFECPFCQRFHQDTREDIISQYVDIGKAILAWKDYPLSFHDPLATKQAIAAQCVYSQKGNDAYFAYADTIFSTTKAGGDGMKESDLGELAKDIEGLNQEEFNTCLSEEQTKDKVQAGIDFGNENGINGTPGFLIGKLEDGKLVDGIRVAGALPIASFEQYIDELLQ